MLIDQTINIFATKTKAMNYNKLRARPDEFRLVTGLNVNEFDDLLVSFEQEWDDFFQHFRLDGEPRSNAAYEHKNSKVKGAEEKLFFIMFYFRHNPTQAVLAAIFEMEKYQANQWIHRLSQILKQCLNKINMLPERNPEKFHELLEKLGEEDVLLDATERPITRSTDYETQKENYSGKKKGHMVKNNLITNKYNRVLYLSGTYEGSVHDKKICDEENVSFIPGINLWKDTGYEGYTPERVNIKQPIKKKRGKEIGLEEKKYNRSISKIRVYVEHAIGRVKIFRIVKEIFRNVKTGYDDLVMEICCGLHNFIISHRPIHNNMVISYNEKD